MSYEINKNLFEGFDSFSGVLDLEKMGSDLEISERTNI